MISMNFLKEIYLRKDPIAGPSLFPITFYNKALQKKMKKDFTREKGNGIVNKHSARSASRTLITEQKHVR